MTLSIAGVEIGSGFPCRIVAELSNNHNGDKDRLGRLIDAAQAAGADVVKFQAYTVDELIALRGDGPAPAPWGDDGTTMRQLYERAQTPLAWFPDIAAHCARVGMPWFSSVFGGESLAVLESVGCPAYKIAALDNGHRWLIKAALDMGKPVLVSVRSYTSLVGITPGVRGLYCPPGYPTALDDVHLPTFGDDEMEYLGLSSHLVDHLTPLRRFDVPTHILLACAAVARDAKLIEMHMMLEREPSALEADVSLTQYELADMVRAVRRTEALLA